jgi:hypothetical protein
MKTYLILFAALASFAPPALAAPVPANLYECQGTGVTVTYAKTSIKGEPTITFQFRDRTVTGSGNAIQTQATVLGDLVTVVRQTVSDSFIDTLTLVAPGVNLTDRLPGVSFNTQLFSTRTRTTVGGPALVEGLIQQSESQRLVCKATLVAF